MDESPFWRGMIKKYGSRDAALAELKRRSRNGGATRSDKPKGFKARPDLVAETSRKGVEARLRAKHGTRNTL